MVLDYRYLKNMDELTELTIHDKHLTDISFVKQMNGLQSLDVSDCNIEDYAGLEYLPELDNLTIGGNPGDPLQILRKRDAEVLRIVIGRIDEEGYEEPLNPLPLLSGYGHENFFQGFTMRDEKVFAEYCFDSQDTLLTDMEIYEYRDEEWQYVLYTSDQKNCFGVYDFENDSFTVYEYVLGCEMPEYDYRIEIGGVPYFFAVIPS